MIKVSPSIVSGSLLNLEATVHALEEAGAESIHFDIEDGSFVPLMGLGTRIIEESRPLTKLPFDVHLMMNNPEWIIPELARFGVDRVSVHYEACPYPRRTLRWIVDNHMQAGLAFNPATAMPPLRFCLPFLTFVVLLSTDPEIGNCSFLPDVLEKLRTTRKIEGMDALEWVVDGGITAENVHLVKAAGADRIVAGRGVFFNGAIKENIQKIQGRSGNVAKEISNA
jgi:ribulose-phosphate 3-epimerase